jgi:hypothetical protein
MIVFYISLNQDTKSFGFKFDSDSSSDNVSFLFDKNSMFIFNLVCLWE